MASASLPRLAALLLAYAAVAATAPSAASFDVIVYGATPAGMAAAVSAANGTGLRVALLEPGPFVGGMSGPGGIGLRDINFEAASGVNDARTVLNRWLHYNRLHYGVAAAVWQPDQYVGQANWERILSDPMYNLTWVTNTGLLEASGAVAMSGTRILSIATVNTTTEQPPITIWSASVFIDATYEAALAIAVNVSWTYGRESRAQYNESWAGVLAPASFAQFQYPVDPFLPNGTLVAGVDAAIPPLGSADDRVMPYSYRLCVISAPGRLPWPKPDDYDSADHELLVRYALSLAAKYPAGPPFSAFVDALEYRAYPSNATLPMRYDLCESGNSAVSTDEPWALYGDYVLGNRSVRARVAARVKSWVLGFAWTLANDARLAPATRASAAGWGLCPDAWPANGHIPPLMYVREGARIIGDSVSTQNSLIKGVCVPTSIGIGSWTIDTHIMRRFVGTISGTQSAQNEGEIGFAPLPGNGTTYELPYSLLLPKRAEATNLLVPSCPSTTHVTFSSVRVEPTFMQLGTAAGVAAALAVKLGGVPVQDVPIAALQTGITGAGQCVHWPNCSTVGQC